MTFLFCFDYWLIVSCRHLVSRDWFHYSHGQASLVDIRVVSLFFPHVSTSLLDRECQANPYTGRCQIYSMPEYVLTNVKTPKGSAYCSVHSIHCLDNDDRGSTEHDIRELCQSGRQAKCPPPNSLVLDSWPTNPLQNLERLFPRQCLFSLLVFISNFLIRFRLSSVTQLWSGACGSYSIAETSWSASFPWVYLQVHSIECAHHRRTQIVTIISSTGDLTSPLCSFQD